MAQPHSLKEVLERVTQALGEYARAHGLGPQDFHVYARSNARWGKVHLLVVSESFNGRNRFECYVEVRGFLEDRFRDEPNFLSPVGLVVRSAEQARQGGVYQVGPGYHEVELGLASITT